MSRTRLVLVAACLAATGGSASAQSLIDRLGENAGRIESIRDVVMGWAGEKPAPQKDVAYAETRAFDMQLHQSLAAKLPQTHVGMAEAKIRADAIPERFGQWLSKISKTGGTVKLCYIEEQNPGSIGIFVDLLLGALRSADKWMLYRPAANYDALVFAHPSGGAIEKTVFYLREAGTEPVCPEGTRQGKPLQI